MNRAISRPCVRCGDLPQAVEDLCFMCSLPVDVETCERRNEGRRVREAQMSLPMPEAGSGFSRR